MTSITNKTDRTKLFSNEESVFTRPGASSYRSETENDCKYFLL